MLIIARTTGVQTVVMNGDRLVTHESYGSNTRVLVGMGKQKCLESLSENRDDVTAQMRQGEAARSFQTVRGTRNQKRPLADWRETNGQNFQTMRGRRPQPSSGCRLMSAKLVKHDCYRYAYRTEG